MYLECCTGVFFMIWKKKKITRSVHLPLWHILTRSRIALPRCGCEVVILWWALTTRCQFVVTKNMTSLPCIRWHILRNCQNTFEAVQKTVQAATTDREDADARNGGVCHIDVCDTIRSWWLFVAIPFETAEIKCGAGKRGCLPEAMLKLEIKL